jgi:hypothetical protein
MDVRERVSDQESSPAPSDIVRGVGESVRPEAIAAGGSAVAHDQAHDGGNQAVGVANLEILDRLAIDGGDRIDPLPFILHTLVAAAVNPTVTEPVCIVLPDVDGVAEIVAAIASLSRLRDDWPQLEERFLSEALHRGMHLRSVRDGKVIGFLGIDSEYVRLRYIDAEGSKTRAALLIPRDMAFGLEPTERKRPIFND